MRTHTFLCDLALRKTCGENNYGRGTVVRCNDSMMSLLRDRRTRPCGLRSWDNMVVSQRHATDSRTSACMCFLLENAHAPHQRFLPPPPPVLQLNGLHKATICSANKWQKSSAWQTREAHRHLNLQIITRGRRHSRIFHPAKNKIRDLREHTGFWAVLGRLCLDGRRPGGWAHNNAASEPHARRRVQPNT